jgi:hypothetical protein
MTTGSLHGFFLLFCDDSVLYILIFCMTFITALLLTFNLDSGRKFGNISDQIIT